jgi:hypothetical protein
MKCKNCGANAEEKFCPNCGQSVKIGKLDGATFVQELTQSIFQVDYGFFYTFKALSLQPGSSIKEYLRGKRKLFFNPISYALLLSTAYFLLAKLLGTETYLGDFLGGIVEGLDGGEINKYLIKALAWFANNYSYTVLLLVPIYAMASHSVFRNAHFSYLEHIILNTYITAQQAMIYSISLIIGITIEEESMLIALPILLSMTYCFWVFKQTFQCYSTLAILLRFAFTYLLPLALTFICLLVLVIAL